MPLHCKWAGVFSEEVATLIQSYFDAHDDLYIEKMEDRSGHHEWEIDLPMGFAAIDFGRIWVEDDIEDRKVVGVRYGYSPSGGRSEASPGMIELVKGVGEVVEEELAVTDQEDSPADFTKLEQHVIDAVAILRELGKTPTNPEITFYMQQEGISHHYDLEPRIYSEDWIARTRRKLRNRGIHV